MLYITADTHFGGFPSVGSNSRVIYRDAENASERIMEQLNDTVRRKDRLIIVGDFAYNRVQYWRNRIHCKNVTLILGNHDQPGACKKAFGEKNVRLQALMKVCGVHTFFSHYPTGYWNGSHRGYYHLYGHLHNCARREAKMDSAWPERRSMDVGIDSAYAIFREHRPFSEEDIDAILSAYKGHDPI